MKQLLRIEEAMMLVLAIYLNTLLPYPWWFYWAFFLAPDLGFIGYAFGTRIGAFTYNILHHKGVGIALYLAGLFMSVTALEFAGLLLFGHSSFDRLLGYGLKYQDSFQNTHLGPIGRQK
jgi:hypothetical protein